MKSTNNNNKSAPLVKKEEKSSITNFFSNLITSIFSSKTSADSLQDSPQDEIFNQYTLKNSLQLSVSTKLPPLTKPYSINEWQEFFSSNSPDTIDQSRLLISLKAGIDPGLRGKIWMFLSHSFESYKENKNTENCYQTLLSGSNPKAEDLISRDIHRTLLNKDKRTVIRVDEKKLFNVLKAYSVYDKDMGYCQGTNSIAATLLQCIGKEEFCFWTFRNLMKIFLWRDFFIQKTPKLFRMLDIMKDNIKAKLTDLYDYFISIKFDEYLDIMFTHFFLTLFTYDCPIELSFRIFDLFWVYEEKVIFDTVINVLSLKKEKIKTMAYEELLVYLKNDLVFDVVEEYGVDYIISMI